MRQLSVGVLTSDPIARLALVTYVQQRPHYACARPATEADIVVATLHDPDTASVGGLRGQAPGHPAYVLLVEGTWRADLHQALDAGVRAVLLRNEFTWDRFGQALAEVGAGRGDLPTVLQGRLMDQVRRTYREALAPRGLTADGLATREVEVLRLIAEGHELQDIASRLGYSERTIKNVLSGTIKRHGLRNRAHAVSFAIRRGLI
ncbi:LuxR C-terminal-related transcriptional regulator [Streptomyces rubiginosohelvolus]